MKIDPRTFRRVDSILGRLVWLLRKGAPCSKEDNDARFYMQKN